MIRSITAPTGRIVEVFIVQVLAAGEWLDAHERQVAGVAFDLADDITLRGVTTRVVKH